MKAVQKVSQRPAHTHHHDFPRLEREKVVLKFCTQLQMSVTSVFSFEIYTHIYTHMYNSLLIFLLKSLL